MKEPDQETLTPAPEGCNRSVTKCRRGTLGCTIDHVREHRLSLSRVDEADGIRFYMNDIEVSRASYDEVIEALSGGCRR